MAAAAGSIIKQKRRKKLQRLRPENRFPSSKRFDENFDCALKAAQGEGEGSRRQQKGRLLAEEPRLELLLGSRMWQTCFLKTAELEEPKELRLGLELGRPRK